MENKHYSKVPVFENGLAQPVFPFTDGKTGEKYDPATSDIVRYCVYVESDYDMDGDGKRDLVKVFVQVPRSAAEGNYKAATLFEARPYCAGVQEDGYDHMKEVAEKEYRKFDLADLDHKAAPRVPSGSASALDLALKADPSDWYYKDKGSTNSMVYENIDSFNYYLVRGFAVIVSAGFGALGSDGFNYVGSEYERDAFKSVVEWIHGDRVAYADREGTITTKADWANGNVAMTGRSYAGTMPFAVATTGVEGLKTIVPVAGIADWYSQQNMQGAQRYWPKEMLNSFLAYYCSSRYNDSTLSEKQLDDMLGSLNLVIVVLIISAGMLAFVVLYNLNTINITERQRELATLKVLGFYDLEVAEYVYRENILLTFIGAGVGVILGKVLHIFVIETVEVDAAMFGRVINMPSYLYSLAFTIAFSMIVNFVMFYKLRKIDMVESLKSVE